MKSAGLPNSLTFSWDQVRRIPLILPAFVLISLVAHISAFFLFQIVYPPQASISAPHPSFSIIDPRRADHQALLRWIDAEDPAPTATGATNIADRLLEIPYRPSFTTMRTEPLVLPESAQPVLFPPARDPLAIIRSVESNPPSPSERQASLPTRVTFSPELSARIPETLPPFTVETKASKPVDSAEFLVGVSDRGEIRYIFPQRPSADPNLVPEAAAMDEEAAAQLSRLKLKPAEAPLTWGRARIAWGAEIYADPKPQLDPAGKSRP